MKQVIVFSFTAILIGVAAVSALSSPTPQEIVDDRVGGMKRLVGNLTALKGASTDVIVKNLAEAIDFSQSVVSKFPKGTGIGDPGVKKSRALQEIWLKPVEFRSAAEALTTALKAAEGAAADQAKLDTALGGVKKSCGGCHNMFRGPEIE